MIGPTPMLLAMALLGVSLGVLNAALLRRAARALARPEWSPWRHAGGFAARTLLTLGPIAIASAGQADRLLVALAAFLLARMLTVRALAAGRRWPRTEAEAAP